MTVSYEGAQILAQLFQAMDDAAKKLEDAYNRRDAEEVKRAKDAINDFQKQIARELENEKQTR